MPSKLGPGVKKSNDARTSDVPFHGVMTTMTHDQEEARVDPPVVSDPEGVAPAAISFRRSTWTTPALLAGLCFLAIWRTAMSLPPEWLAVLPWWLFFAVICVLPELFLLVYPLVTRRQEIPTRFRLPRLNRILIEALLAIPVIIGCALVISVVQIALVQVYPEASFTPESFGRMTRSTEVSYTYGILLFSFLCAPIAEEAFFRGFLFNAFSKHMPVAAAMLLQAVIFGFVHPYGSIPALGAAFLGLALSLVYRWRRTILTPIFVHAGWNGMMAVGMFFIMSANANAPVLGVYLEESKPECVIATVAPGSPAESAGLQPGDTVTEFGDYSTPENQHLLTAISLYETGDSIMISVERGGETLQLQVTLASRSSVFGTPP